MTSEGQTTVADPFDEHLAQWQAWAEAPWGRIRFAVVRQTLGWQVDQLGGGPLRILDVGGGDGRDSVPLAAAGHVVTVVDTAPRMLEEAVRRADEAGATDRVSVVEGSIEDLSAVGRDYDLVLCHFVLHYLPADAGDVRRLAALLRPGGRLSVIAPNPAGSVLQRLVRGGPAAAYDELATEEWRTATFQHSGRKVEAEEIRKELSLAGLQVVAHHGGRCANDVLTDDEAKHDPGYYAELERLELALCNREPFKRLGMFWQLVAEKPAP